MNLHYTRQMLKYLKCAAKSRRPGMSNLALKLGQIGPKWDKSGFFFRSDFSSLGSLKVPDLSNLGPI